MYSPCLKAILKSLISLLPVNSSPEAAYEIAVRPYATLFIKELQENSEQLL
jgi:hypothetical protein